MHAVKMLCCSILQREVEHVLKKNGIQAEITYLDCALHVFPDRLGMEVRNYLKSSPGAVVIYGNKCCMNMEKIAAENDAVLIGANNCVEMILGTEWERQDQAAKTFFLTGGWFENWNLIVIETLKWDRVDARQNFGYCDRILMVDTGLVEMPETQLLEIFDYTGVPIENFTTDLNHFESLLISTINSSRGN